MCKAETLRFRPCSQHARIAPKRALSPDLYEGEGLARSSAGHAAQIRNAASPGTRLASKEGGDAFALLESAEKEGNGSQNGAKGNSLENGKKANEGSSKNAQKENEESDKKGKGDGKKR